MSEQPEVQWLTTDDLAKAWQIKPSTLANWRLVEGKGPAFVRIGGVVRYRAEVVAEWLAKQPTK